MDEAPITVSGCFARALHLSPPPSLKPQPLAGGAYCTLRHCGRPITVGYAVTDITTDATNEFVDTFRGSPSGYACADCAALFTQDHNMGAWMIFEDGDAYNPLISRESAAAVGEVDDGPKPEVKRAPKIDRSAIARPCWSDLFRRVWPFRQGQNVVILLTTNTKKRQWPRAQIGPLGARTPVYLHDGPDESIRLLDWPRLLRCLDLIEEAYTAGFSKESIRVNLLMQTKAVDLLGMATTARMERSLSMWRASSEFVPALLVAQKPLEVKSK